MIQINLRKVAKARNIDNLYNYLIRIGFTPKIATYWATGKPKRIDLEHLERVCKNMKCEPYDIMEWTPDEHEKPFLDQHPLKKLLAKPDVVDVKYVMRMLPKEELDELLEEIKKRQDKLLGPQTKLGGEGVNFKERKKRKPNLKWVPDDKKDEEGKGV